MRISTSTAYRSNNDTSAMTKTAPRLLRFRAYRKAATLCTFCEEFRRVNDSPQVVQAKSICDSSCGSTSATITRHAHTCFWSGTLRYCGRWNRHRQARSSRWRRSEGCIIVTGERHKIDSLRCVSLLGRRKRILSIWLAAACWGESRGKGRMAGRGEPARPISRRHQQPCNKESGKF